MKIIYLVTGEDSDHSSTKIKAFENRNDAETFINSLKEYDLIQPAYNDRENYEIWMKGHPAGMYNWAELYTITEIALEVGTATNIFKGTVLVNIPASANDDEYTCDLRLHLSLSDIEDIYSQWKNGVANNGKDTIRNY
jgi:hypothetical protein